MFHTLIPHKIPLDILMLHSVLNAARQMLSLEKTFTEFIEFILLVWKEVTLRPCVHQSVSRQALLGKCPAGSV